MTYADLRKGRLSETGRAYLVTTVTANRVPVFADWHCACLMVRTLCRVQALFGVSSFAWVLMPDHFHWLMAPGADASLSLVMQRLKGLSAAGINRWRGASGPLWQGAFHDHAVRDGEDIRTIARDVVANPLRAGLVTEIGAYSFWDAVWLDPLAG